MALVIKDRVKQSSTTAGTGTLTLSGTYTGYQAFSVIGNGNTTYYAIVDVNAGTWEIGRGTYTASGTTLSRDTVYASSSGGGLVTFSTNDKEVFVTYPADYAVTTDLTQALTNKTFPAGTALLPSITTTGDTNTGIYFPAADTWAVTTGGTERLRVDASGNVGIGVASVTAQTLRVAKSVTGATSAYGITNQGAVLSDVTNTAVGFYSGMTTQAAAFTLGSYKHFSVGQDSIGASSAVTSAYGYVAESSLTGATNNYGFYGAIAAGTGRYNLYMAGTADNYMAGALGIGSTPFAGATVRIAKTITGATNAYGITNEGVVQSDVTTAAYYFRTAVATQAASFTLAGLVHYLADQSTIGATSTVTTQTGFYAASTLTGATNNWGFRGNIASGSGRYNLYMDGTADNYLAGALGIGTTGVSGRRVRLGGNITGGVAQLGFEIDPTIQSDVTTSVYYMRTSARTAAASFTLSTLVHFGTEQNTLGAGSAITSQYGFFADSTLTSATNNYGFYGNIASGSNRYNLFMNGTASNYLAGNLGIGNTSVTQFNLRISTAITGSTASQAVRVDGTVQSGVTSSAAGYTTSISTAAAAFNVVDLFHFLADQGTIGASSSVTNQYGFFVGSTLTGATNNYGFYGNIASGTGRYNLFMNGTAANYLGGNLGIGNTTLTAVNLNVGALITGGTSAYAISMGGTVQSGVTNTAYYAAVSGNTAAAAFTVNTIQMYTAGFSSLGAGSAVTNLYGFRVESSLTVATNNYGFYGNIASGTGRWNLYMNGSANNYLSGRLGIGSTSLTDATVRIDANMTGAANSYHVLVTGVVQSDVAGATYIRADLNTQATAFTLSTVKLFSATSQTLGAGSAVTNLYGYYAESNLTTGTNNYGFYGNIASGSNRYNLFMNGTANNYLAGNLGIGSTDLPSTVLHIQKTTTGATTARGVWMNSAIQSDVTLSANLFQTSAFTAASAFTLTSLRHFYALQGTIGATSAVTNQYGFVVDSSMTGATNNYGFYSDIGAASGRWAFYDNGGAASYFKGDHQFDKTVTAGGTTGAQTINKNAGSVNFAAAATSLVVTNSRVTTSSIIVATVATNDSTMKSVLAVAGSGSFTLYANAAATAETRVNFIVIN